MSQIYDYISSSLKRNNAAQRIIKEVNDKIIRLSNNPYLYSKIDKVDRLKLEYHKIIVNNYIVLYSIDSSNNKVFVSRIFYGKMNYLYF